MRFVCYLFVSSSNLTCKETILKLDFITFKPEAGFISGLVGFTGVNQSHNETIKQSQNEFIMLDYKNKWKTCLE